MSSDDRKGEAKKPGVFGRLFGRGGRDDATPEADETQPAATLAPAEQPAEGGGSWFQRLKSGLSKTSTHSTFTVVFRVRSRWLWMPLG